MYIKLLISGSKRHVSGRSVGLGTTDTLACCSHACVKLDQSLEKRRMFLAQRSAATLRFPAQQPASSILVLLIPNIWDALSQATLIPYLLVAFRTRLRSHFDFLCFISRHSPFPGAKQRRFCGSDTTSQLPPAPHRRSLTGYKRR